MNKGEAVIIEPAKNGFIVRTRPDVLGTVGSDPMVFETLESLKRWLDFHFSDEEILSEDERELRALICDPYSDYSEGQDPPKKIEGNELGILMRGAGFRELTGEQIKALNHEEIGFVDRFSFVESEASEVEQPESLNEAKARILNDEWDRHKSFK